LLERNSCDRRYNSYRAPSPFTLVALADQNPLSHYWHKITDRTFTGIYHANAFDLAMMIPYFIVLFVWRSTVSIATGWFTIICLFEEYSPCSAAGHELSRVTVQLPIFNERYVIERLVEAVSRFDYPAELLDVQVLDDSTDETCEVARACVERHAAQGCPSFISTAPTGRLQSRRP